MSHPATPQPASRGAEWAFLGIGVICLGYGLWTWVDAGVYQFLQGRRLDALTSRIEAVRARLDGGGTGAVAKVDPQGLIGRIEIGRIGLSAIVAEGVDARTLRRAVGHVAQTALPGEDGNVVLAGHRDSFFRRLGEVREGDRVTLQTPEGEFEYRVDSTEVVGADRVDLLEPESQPTLTLITCYPFNFVGPAPDRFVVRGREAR